MSAWSMPTLSNREFQLFQKLVQREAGIHLGEHKRSLVVGRLAARLRALGLGSFEAYHRVVQEDEAERTTMIDCICTNETHFFREPQQFDFLTQRVFPHWRGDETTRRRRVWSAACSTGEEPYTLAMVWLEHFPAASGWSVDLLATDLSTRVLARASEGVWALRKAEEIPTPLLKRYMLKGTGRREGTMKAGDELRALIRFEQLNLVTGPLPPGPPFDVIFCRNVLIYFDQPTRVKVVRRLLSRLVPGGYLFLGHAETLNGLSDQARCAMPTVYRNEPPAAPRARPSFVEAG